MNPLKEVDVSEMKKHTKCGGMLVEKGEPWDFSYGDGRKELVQPLKCLKCGAVIAGEDPSTVQKETLQK